MADVALPNNGYFAVIFSAQRSALGADYAETAARMEGLAEQSPGYLGFESARGPDGFGIAISYWRTEDDIATWKRNLEHLEAQHRGRNEWYTNYSVRIARVERSYDTKKRQETN